MKADSGYDLVLESEPSRDDVRVVQRGLRDFNLTHIDDGHDQDEQVQRLAIFVRHAETGAITGGLVGKTFWDWLDIDLLWLPDELRGQGYGSRLLALAEDEARRRGCRHAYLDTFSFQAPGFYERHGYTRYGALSDFPPGYVRYYYTKDL